MNKGIPNMYVLSIVVLLAVLLVGCPLSSRLSIFISYSNGKDFIIMFFSCLHDCYSDCSDNIYCADRKNIILDKISNTDKHMCIYKHINFYLGSSYRSKSILKYK